MISSELKRSPEILRYLEGKSRMFVVGCEGCAEVGHTGDKPQVLEMKQKLEQEEKAITGYYVVDFLCGKALVETKLSQHQSIRCLVLYWMSTPDC